MKKFFVKDEIVKMMFVKMIICSVLKIDNYIAQIRVFLNDFD